MALVSVTNERIEKLAQQIGEELSRPFSGYLGEAMMLGSKLVTCQRILNGDLLVEADGIKVLTEEQMDARYQAHLAKQAQSK